jgi:hypothetical protein
VGYLESPINKEEYFEGEKKILYTSKSSQLAQTM